MKWFKLYGWTGALIEGLSKILEDGKITLSDIPLIVNTVSEVFGLSMDESITDLVNKLSEDNKE